MKRGLELALLVIGLGAGMTVGVRFLERRAERHWREQDARLETLDGRMMLQTGELELRLGQLTRLMPELQEQLRGMRIELKRVEEVQATAMRMNREFGAVLRDSVVSRIRAPTPGDSTTRVTERWRVFDYSDHYLQVKGVARGDSQWMRVAVRDTLLQVVYRGKRTKPWLWIFSPRELTQTVRLGNPDAEISYSRRIRIGKK